MGRFCDWRESSGAGNPAPGREIPALAGGNECFILAAVARECPGKPKTRMEKAPREAFRQPGCHLRRSPVAGGAVPGFAHARKRVEGEGRKRLPRTRFWFILHNLSER